jgi:hypothetical protein
MAINIDLVTGIYFVNVLTKREIAAHLQNVGNFIENIA